MKMVSFFLIILMVFSIALVSCRQTTPEPPSVEPPAPTETPTTPETPTPNDTPLPKLEVEWVTFGPDIPRESSTFIGWAWIVTKDGETIYAKALNRRALCIGKNGGKDWQIVEDIPEEVVKMYVGEETLWEIVGGQEAVISQLPLEPLPRPLTKTRQYKLAIDPNNNDHLLLLVIDPPLEVDSEGKVQKLHFMSFRLLLSTDRGCSWVELTRPFSDRKAPPAINTLAVVTHGSELKLFLAIEERQTTEPYHPTVGNVWQTTIPAKSLP